MSMTILRKPAGVSGLKGLSKEPVTPRGFHVPPSRDYEKRKLTLVELRFLLQQRDIEFQDACYLMILIVKPSDEESTTFIR